MLRAAQAVGLGLVIAVAVWIYVARPRTDGAVIGSVVTGTLPLSLTTGAVSLTAGRAYPKGAGWDIPAGPGGDVTTGNATKAEIELGDGLQTHRIGYWAILDTHEDGISVRVLETQSACIFLATQTNGVFGSPTKAISMSVVPKSALLGMGNGCE